MDAQNGETDFHEIWTEEMMNEGTRRFVSGVDLDRLAIDDHERRIRALEEMIPQGHFLIPNEGCRPAEPAPGSDAEHPPVGYRLAKVGDRIVDGAVVWMGGRGPWDAVTEGAILCGGVHVTKMDPAIANPIPANEGDSRLAESVAIPVGWVACGQTAIGPGKYREHGGQWITPDPSIPWGEGYEEILPSEARNGGSCEFWADDTRKRWIPAERVQTWDERCRNQYAWRRRIPATTPTEPARDLSDKIAESVVQDLQQACHDRDELRATVERLEAENAELRGELTVLRSSQQDAKDAARLKLVVHNVHAAIGNEVSR